MACSEGLAKLQPLIQQISLIIKAACIYLVSIRIIFGNNSHVSGDIEENEEALNGYVEEEDDFHAEEEEEDFFKQDSITEDMYSNTHNGSVGINTTGGSRYSLNQ